MASGTAAVTARDKQSAQLRERAKRLLIQKRFQRAVEVCNEALKLTPGNYKVLRIRSTAWCQIGEYEKSLADADVVLKAVPYSGDAWYQKGYSHFHLKDYMAAAHAFARGLEQNGADRTLQHGFTDALTLMSRIKAVHTPVPQSSASLQASATGQPAPAASNTLAELVPHLPLPPDEEAPGSGVEAPTGEQQAEGLLDTHTRDCDDGGAEVDGPGDGEVAEVLPAEGGPEVGMDDDEVAGELEGQEPGSTAAEDEHKVAAEVDCPEPGEVGVEQDTGGDQAADNGGSSANVAGVAEDDVTAEGDAEA